MICRQPRRVVGRIAEVLRAKPILDARIHRQPEQLHSRQRSIRGDALDDQPVLVVLDEFEDFKVPTVYLTLPLQERSTLVELVLAQVATGTYVRRQRPDPADDVATRHYLGQDRRVELDVLGEKRRDLFGGVVSAFTECAQWMHDES